MKDSGVATPCQMLTSVNAVGETTIRITHFRFPYIEPCGIRRRRRRWWW